MTFARGIGTFLGEAWWEVVETHRDAIDLDVL